MKNFLTRLIAVLLGVVLLGVGIFIIAASSDLVPVLWTRLGLRAGQAYPVIGLAGGVNIVTSLFLLLAIGFRSSRRPAETILQYSELGEVRISIAAIENMVLRVTQQHNAIKESNRKVVKTPRGLVVYLRAKVMPDLNLPSLASELQQNVNSYIEEVTGIKVAEVKVLVENIVSDLTVRKKPPLN
ncbi:MAG TPA: alkaline shock response membrane anchor protein AmaP [Firmicutes bacterium]|nr:alkaline shock response membrane anchor protein AmaP [Bacillota bacterium]